MEQQPISPKSVANFRMIDISAKGETHRIARASGFFYAQPETLQLIKERRLPKGDVLVLCEVAGIQAAKRTIDLLPLCHPLDLSSVRVWTEFEENNRIKVSCEAQTVGKTGVEMEALCGATAALLCIYDLAKGVDPVLRIGDVQLEFKQGGKSGVWNNPSLPSAAGEVGGLIKKTDLVGDQAWAEIQVCALTVSDRAARGQYEDRSGPVIHDWLIERNSKLLSHGIVPDNVSAINETLKAWIQKVQPNLIITTGGTGLSPRDVTPEALNTLAETMNGRIIPGIGERLRSYGSQFTKNAWLSRSVAIQVGQTIVVCLPGSPKAVKEGMQVLSELIPHALKMIRGEGHEAGK
ncbi:MAG: Cyclic pyranopterin monophosphate synthase accessory protein 1 [Pseudomonadota bacterium]|jgi:molybdenum cofactor biosynthesis protein MoaC